jgi:hypothetical protein
VKEACAGVVPVVSQLVEVLPSWTRLGLVALVLPLLAATFSFWPLKLGLTVPGG